MICSVVDNHHSLIGSHISFQKQFTDTMRVVEGWQMTQDQEEPSWPQLQKTARKKKQRMNVSTI